MKPSRQVTTESFLPVLIFAHKVGLSLEKGVNSTDYLPFSFGGGGGRAGGGLVERFDKS